MYPLQAATQTYIFAYKWSKRCRMSSCDRLSQVSCTRCRNPAMIVAGSGERVRSFFIMSHTREIWGSCCPEQLYTTKSTWHRSSCMWMCVEKEHNLPVEEMADHGVNNLCNVAGTVYFTLQNPQIWPRVVTMAPTLWSLRWGLCVVGECNPEDDHQVYAVYVYVHRSHTGRTYSHH